MIDENGTLNLTGIKEVNEHKYFNNKELKKIIIGNTLEEIEEYSFYGCTNLEEIDFSNTTLKEINNTCFSCCKSLKSIHLPSSIKSISIYSFEKCYNLESVILDGVNDINRYVFENCNRLKEFVFYEDIENLEENNIFNKISAKQKIKITCPDKYVDYFKKRFPESEINNDNQYVLK